MSRRRLILLATSGVLAIVLLSLTLRMFRYPTTENPAAADAVVMLAGGGDRIDAAVELGVEQGIADTVVFSAAWIDDGGYWSARPCNVSGRSRMRDTTAICFQPDPDNTRGEIRAIARMAREHGWTRIVVVASIDQVTRARMMLSRCWDGEALFVGVPHDQTFVRRAIHEWAAMTKALTVNRGC